MPPEIHDLRGDRGQEGTLPAAISDRRLGALLRGSVIELRGPDTRPDSIVLSNESSPILGFPVKTRIAYLDLPRASGARGFQVVPEELGMDFFVPHDGEARIEATFAGSPSRSGQRVVLSARDLRFVVTGTETAKLESRPVSVGGHSYRVHTDRTILFLEPEDENWRGLKPGSLRLVVDLYGTEPRAPITLGEFFGGSDWSPAASPEARGTRLFSLRVGVLRRSLSGR